MDYNATGPSAAPTSEPSGALSSTQSGNTPAGPQPGSGPNVGSRGLAQTQGGTARSLSRAQFSGAGGM